MFDHRDGKYADSLIPKSFQDDPHLLEQSRAFMEFLAPMVVYKPKHRASADEMFAQNSLNQTHQNRIEILEFSPQIRKRFNFLLENNFILF